MYREEAEGNASLHMTFRDMLRDCKHQNNLIKFFTSYFWDEFLSKVYLAIIVRGRLIGTELTIKRAFFFLSLLL